MLVDSDPLRMVETPAGPQFFDEGNLSHRRASELFAFRLAALELMDLACRYLVRALASLILPSRH